MKIESFELGRSLFTHKLHILQKNFKPMIRILYVYYFEIVNVGFTYILFVFLKEAIRLFVLYFACLHSLCEDLINKVKERADRSIRQSRGLKR